MRLRGPCGVCLGVGQRWSLPRGMPFLRVGPGARRGVLLRCASVPVPAPSWPLSGFLPPRCVASGALSLWVPVPHLGPFRAPLPECPFLSLALPLPVPFPFPVWWWWGGGGGTDGPGLGVGGLKPLAEGWGGVGGAEALDRVAEEGLPGGLRHDGLRGGLVGVGGAAGADLPEGVHHVPPFSPSRSPGPLHPAAELLQGGGRPPGEVGGGLGGGGVRARGPGAAEGERGVRRWRVWWRLGERERRWRGLGVEDGYGRRGGREGEVDMGRRRRAWRRLGDREVWWWRLGVEDRYGRWGEWGARWGPWGEGEVDMGRRWRAWRRPGERERWWRGLGVGVAYGRRREPEARWGSWGEGKVDIWRRWRAWWRPGEQERQKRGPGGSWWRFGEREPREGRSFGFCCGLVDEVRGRGGSEDEVEGVDEAGDEEEVVVLGDTGCAVTRAIAGLWAAGSAAATAGRMEGMSLGCTLGAGGWGGPAMTWRPGGPIWSAVVGEGGAGLQSSPSGLGWAGVRQCVRLCGLAPAGGSSSGWLHFRGGSAWVLLGVRGGRVRGNGRAEGASGRGAPRVGCVRVVECGQW